MAQYKGIGYDTTGKVRTGTSADTVQFNGAIDVVGNASVGGNLNVVGDIISGGSENVVISDPAIDLGVGATTAQTTGFSFVAKAGTNSNTITSITQSTRVVVCTAATSIAANDIVQISGSSDPSNNGLYVVASVASPNITLGNTAYVGTAPFIQTALGGDSTGGTISQVNLKALVVAGNGLINDSGASPYAEGTLLEAFATDAAISDFTTDGSYSAVGATSPTTLQDAYDNGNSITLTSGNNFTIAKSLSGSAAVSLGANAASNFTVDGASITLQTNTSGDVVLTSAGDVDINGGAAVTIDASVGGVSIDGADASNFTTSTGALTLDGATGVNIAGNAAEIDITTSGALDLNSGAFTLDASSISMDGTAASNFTIAGADLVLQTTTTGDITANAVDTLTLKSQKQGVQAVVINAEGGTGGDVVIQNNGVDQVTVNTNGFALNAGVTVASILDQDDMSSDSDTALATQQSIKAYVDTSLQEYQNISQLTDGSSGAIAAGDVVAVGSSGTAIQADADASSTCRVVGICVATGGGNIFVQQIGNITGLSGLTAGDTLYASLTAGALTNDVSSFTTGDVVFVVGYATSTTSMIVAPRFVMEIG